MPRGKTRSSKSGIVKLGAWFRRACTLVVDSLGGAREGERGEGGEDFMFFSSREGASFLRLIGLQSEGCAARLGARKSETELTNGQETRVRRSEETKVLEELQFTSVQSGAMNPFAGLDV